VNRAGSKPGDVLVLDRGTHVSCSGMRSTAGGVGGEKKTGPLVGEGRGLAEGSLVSLHACAPCTHAPVRLSNRRNAHAHATNEIERESFHLAELQRTVE
jgi:hypothetical protein